MKFIAGLLTVILCVFGAFVLQGGHLSVLGKAAPLELVIIFGTSVGAFIIANPKVVIFRVLSYLKYLVKKPTFDKASFIEVLSMMYQVFKLAKTKGMLALEQHVDKPEESSLFSSFHGFLHEHHAVEFFTDYLRLMTLGADKPYELEALMDEEIEVHHGENEAVFSALNAIADGMPAIGIVAAVLGVIHTMGSITEPPEVLGRLIGGALVGTFMGVLLSYGIFAPIANCVKQALDAESRYIQCLKIGLMAHLQGCAPSVSIEYARKALLSNVRPTFAEVEEATQALPAPG